MGDNQKGAYLGVTVAALGYFVDVYDLILFSVVRQSSLQSLGLSGDELVNVGLDLLNLQMIGMLLGGVIFGIWGDLKGRVSVLFGSILLYSVANILNGMVESIPAYGALRFIAGIGLAGELGAGITLVSEIMSRTGRGYGTTLVAGIGVMGAIAAALVGERFDWRVAYYIGGVMGLALLALRVFVHESGMYHAVSSQNVRRGDLRLLLKSRERAARYLICILVGMPVWFVVGIIITLAPEFGRAFGMAELPTAPRAVFYGYVGLIAGDLGSGFLSQFLQSRRKVLFIFYSITLVGLVAFFTFAPRSLESFYYVCVLLGFSVGAWAVVVSMAAEQFGTNLRATVTTTVPNFIRGSLVPITLLFTLFKGFPGIGIIGSAQIVGVLCVAIALVAAYLVPESFGKDLNFIEE